MIWTKEQTAARFLDLFLFTLLQSRLRGKLRYNIEKPGQIANRFALSSNIGLETGKSMYGPASLPQLGRYRAQPFQNLELSCDSFESKSRSKFKAPPIGFDLGLNQASISAGRHIFNDTSKNCAASWTEAGLENGDCQGVKSSTPQVYNDSRTNPKHDIFTLGLR
jgi:hypothetical protein